MSSVVSRIRAIGARFDGRFYESTVMYDNPNKKLSFYRKEIDGRLRLRTSIFVGKKSIQDAPKGLHKKSKLYISWKRRIPGGRGQGMTNTEEESECYIVPDQTTAQEATYIFEKVLQCPRVSSYERYRSFYIKSGVQITVDEFPFGIMLEIEGGSDLVILKIVKQLGFSIEESSSLSCDDMYHALCKQQGKKIYADILFKNANPLILEPSFSTK